MVSEELLFIERLGVGGAAFFLVYLLLKNMQKKVFEQSDRTLDLAENVIIENTKTLQQMRDELEAHRKSKEPFIEQIKECRQERNEFLKSIEEKVRGG